KDDIALLDAHYFEEIFDKYIIQVAGKGFTVVNHPSEVYRYICISYQKSLSNESKSKLNELKASWFAIVLTFLEAFKIFASSKNISHIVIFFDHIIAIL
ncbi:12676_t:CDS:1, partial [Cetraspora pellucida]